MKKHKVELSVILSLTIVLTLLVFSVGATIGDMNASSSVSAEIKYEKYRSATPSLIEGLEIEQTLYGEGDESLVSAWGANQRVYIFLNTTSSTLDFSQGAGAYICVLDELLSTVAFHYLGKDKLLSATLGEGGFLLCFACDGGVSLALYGFDCALLKRTEVFEGEYCSTLLLSDGYLLTLYEQLTTLSKRTIQAYKVDFSLELDFSHTLSSSRDMQYVCSYQRGKNIVIFFNAVNDLGTRLGASVFGRTSAITYLLKEGDYRTHEVLPWGSGFVAVASGDNAGYLLDIDEQFNSDFAKTVEGDFVGASLNFGCGIYYAHFEGERPLALVFEDLAQPATFSGFDGLSKITGALNGTDYTLFCAITSRGGEVTSSNFSIALGGEDCFLFTLNGEVFALSTIKKDDASLKIGRLDF